jgi:signal peptidase I
MQRTGGMGEAEMDTGAASNGHPHREGPISDSSAANSSPSTDPGTAAEPTAGDPEPSAATAGPSTGSEPTGTEPTGAEAVTDAGAEIDAGGEAGAETEGGSAPATGTGSAEAGSTPATGTAAAASAGTGTATADSAEPEGPAAGASGTDAPEAAAAAADPASAPEAEPDGREEPAARPGSTIWDNAPPTPAGRPGRAPSKGGRMGRKVAIVLATLLLMAAIPALVARMYAIPSESMETTLHGCAGCTNDRVLVDRMVYRFTDPAPGEVVVFKAGPDVWHNSEVQDPGPGNPIIAGLLNVAGHLGVQQSAGSDFVKRVIAVGGQTVACCDERNRVMVDGAAVDEPYIHFAVEFGPAMQQKFGPVTVPEGYVFLMGDNRNASLDSRAPGNGPVPLSALAGKARLIVYPFDRVGPISGANPQLVGPNS